MASGDSLCVFSAQHNVPPSTGYAAFVGWADGDLQLDFNTSGDAAIFRGFLPKNYNAGGITAYLHWTLAGTSTGNVGWALAFERSNDANHKIGTNGFATCQIAASVAATATCYQLITSNAVITNGANMDSLAAGDFFRLKVTSASSDGYTANRRLVAIELRET